MNKNKENILLNFTKGISCLGVVLIHVCFPGIIGEILKKIFSYAVPLFFMISGYYIYGQNIEVTKRRLKKIIKYFIYSFLIYLVFNIIKNYNQLLIWISQIFNLKNIIKLIVFCTIDWAIPLWYLIAMIETYVFWIIFYEKINKGTYKMILPILFGLQIISVTICETLDLSWLLKINFITRALPWFMLGYSFAENESKIAKISMHSIILYIFIGTIIAILPTIINTRIKFECIGYILIAPSIFAISLKFPEIHINSIIEFIGKKLSLYIYVFHVLIGTVILTFIQKLFGINEESIYMYFHPIITIMITITFSYIYFKIIEKFKKDNTIN